MNILVTCIYNNLANTSFGGRNCRDDRYRDSLLTIARTGVPIICYTNAHSYTKLVNFFTTKNVMNIDFRLLELDTLPFHQRIQEIKKNFPEKFDDLFWHQRCVELMWGKLWMISQVMTEYPMAENIFWIDAGLCHNDVISPKYSLASDITQGISSNPYTLMNKNFVPNLKKFAKDKVIAIESVAPHNNPIPEKYNTVPYRTNNGMVGGLFGGNFAIMQFIVIEFFKKVEMILAYDELYGEENILSAIVNEHPHLFSIFQFESWYHEGWAAWRDPAKVVFSNFFDVITEKEEFEDRVVFTTLAIGDKYREISLEFLKSFTAYGYGKPLVIVTDKIDFYPKEMRDNIYFNFVQIAETIPVESSTTFLYNLKYKAIEEAHQLFPKFNKLIYLDCDCYFIAPFWDDSLYEDISPGLNVVLGSHASTIMNRQIVLKMEAVARTPDDMDVQTFRECALVFGIDNKYIFRNFLVEWSFIYDEIVAKKQVHVGECTDILMAAKRASMPVRDLSVYGLNDLRGLIYTTIQDAPVRAIL